MTISIDYNERLAENIETIRDKVKRGMLPLIARVPAIDKAASEYVLAQDDEYERKRAKLREAGRSENIVPIQLRDSDALERLADLIMYEELTWSHPDKMSIVEYPVMSDDQEELRHSKYTPHDDLQYGDVRFTGRRKVHFTDDKGAPQVRSSRIINPYDTTIDRVGDLIDLESALENAGLTDRQRQAVELVYFEDMTQEEAAEALGVRQNTLNEHLAVGLRKLREYMA